MNELFEIYYENYIVRNFHARTIEPKYLSLMLNDHDFLVRLNIIRRINRKYFPGILDYNIPFPLIRKEIEEKNRI